MNIPATALHHTAAIDGLRPGSLVQDNLRPGALEKDNLRPDKLDTLDLLLWPTQFERKSAFGFIFTSADTSII